MKWTDLRLRYTNLRVGDVNEITPDELEKIWMPTILFGRTRDMKAYNWKNSTSLTTVVIDPEARPKQNPMRKLHNGFIYAGNDW